MIRKFVFGAVVFTVFSWVSPAEAQRFGQWRWAARLGVSGRDLKNTSGGGSESSSHQIDYRLGLDVDGFILHPAVGRFRLGIDGRYNDVSGGRSVDATRLGYRGDIRMFPQGSVPFGLFFDKRLYGYSDIAGEDPRVLIGSPDSSTTWGGDVAMRRGVLKGSRVGFDRTKISFLDPDSRDEIREHEYFEWSPSSRNLQHIIRFERRYREFGTVDFTTDDRTLTYGQNGFLISAWRWNLSGVAIRRETVNAGLRNEIDTGRLQATTSRELGDDLLRFTYSGGVVSGDQLNIDSTTHSLNGGYLIRHGNRWQFGPTAGYAYSRAGNLTTAGPTVGGTATWAGRSGPWSWLLGGRAAFQQLEHTRDEASAAENGLGLSAQVSLTHGSVDRLFKELEINASRNQLRAGGDFEDFPDLGLSLAALGSEDDLRGRVTLRRGVPAGRLSFYFEGRQRRSTPDTSYGSDFQVSRWISNLEFGGRKFSVLANAGTSTAKGTTFNPQETVFLTSELSWRPWTFLRLWGYYRYDDRRIVLAPKLETELVEAGAAVYIGLLEVGAIYRDVFNRSEGSPGRRNRSIRWYVTRRFFGLLPIVSAPQRRGEIR